MEALWIWVQTNPMLSLGTAALLAVFVFSALGIRKAARELEEAKKKGVELHPHIHSPIKNGHKTLWDRMSPLLYEETPHGKWKLSLGRVSFWMTQASFIGMCMVVTFTLRDQHKVDGNVVTLYISVITMLFLTNLGLLGYNLGTKFTEPMKQFILSWGSRDNTSNVLNRAQITHQGYQPAPETAPANPTPPPTGSAAQPPPAAPTTPESADDVPVIEQPPEGWTPGGGDDH